MDGSKGKTDIWTDKDTVLSLHRDKQRDIYCRQGATKRLFGEEHGEGKRQGFEQTRVGGYYIEQQVEADGGIRVQRQTERPFVWEK